MRKTLGRMEARVSRVRQSTLANAVNGGTAVALLAVVISTGSLIVSFLAFQLARGDYDASRALVLSCTFNAKRGVLTARSATPDVALQWVTVDYPESLHLSRSTFGPPDWGTPSAPVCNAISRNRSIAALKAKATPGLVFSGVPVLVDASYVAKGKALHSKRTYWLVVDLEWSKKQSNPRVTPIGLALLEDHSGTTPAFLDDELALGVQQILDDPTIK